MNGMDLLRDNTSMRPSSQRNMQSCQAGKKKNLNPTSNRMRPRRKADLFVHFTTRLLGFAGAWPELSYLLYQDYFQHYINILFQQI